MRYLTSSSKTGHELLDDADAARLEAPSAIRPDIERPIWHCSLSLPEGEQLSTEKWQVVAGEFVRRMGLDKHEWTAVVHRETEHEHCHVVANRIGWTGEVWAGEFDGRRAIASAKSIEAAHGLTVDHHRPTGRAALTQPEVEQALRTGIQPTRTTLQELIDRAAQGSGFATFARELEQHGVQVSANVASTGRVSGLAFGYDGATWKGSDLGRAYGWKQLQERIGYEQSRDSTAIQERAASRARGEAARATVGGQDRRRAGGTSSHDGEHRPADGGPVERDDSARPSHQRQRSTERQDADQDGRSTVRDHPTTGPDRAEVATATARPVSALARSRGPISGARERVRHLAAALRDHFQPTKQTEHITAAGHDRHGPARPADRRTVAAVSAGLER